MVLRGKTIYYSSYKNKLRNSQEHVLLYIESNLNEINKDRLIAFQSKLTQIRNEKLYGSFFRANWIEHGERSSKYFCNFGKTTHC